MNDLQIYVISLAKNNPRRDRLTEAFAPLGQPYEIFDALDGRGGLDPALEPEIDRKAAAQTMRRQMSDSEFACALSHRKVMERFLDGNGKWSLIMEDDIILDARIGRFLAEGGYRSAPLLLLHHRLAWILGDGIPIAGIESLAFRLAPSIPHSFCSPLPGNSFAAPTAFLPNSTAAYIVNRSIAQCLVEAHSPIRSVADWPIDIAKQGAHAVVPAIVTINKSLNSAIEPTLDALLPPLPRGKIPLSKKIFMSVYWGRKWSKLRGARQIE